MGRVVVLGASLMDMNLRLDRLPTPGETRLGSSFFTSTGGKGANQAVAARRAGADVVFLSAFGDDAFGLQMRDRYFDEGIDIGHARIVEAEASGVALILVGDDGENLIGVSMGPNARLSPEYIDDLPAEVFDASGVFLASLEVPIETVIRAIERAKAAGMTVVLNLFAGRLAAGCAISSRSDGCSDANYQNREARRERISSVSARFGWTQPCCARVEIGS